MTNLEHLISPNISYIPKLDHRNGSPQKSQWTISEQAEQQCFYQAYNLWQQAEYTCWGLHFENGKAVYLGKSKISSGIVRDLFIAKFLDSNANCEWHGYPADHTLNHQDIPPTDVLAVWLKDGHLRQAAIRKITKGQKCKL